MRGLFEVGREMSQAVRLGGVRASVHSRGQPKWGMALMGPEERVRESSSK